jgi:hypothetical protein
MKIWPVPLHQERPTLIISVASMICCKISAVIPSITFASELSRGHLSLLRRRRFFLRAYPIRGSGWFLEHTRRQRFERVSPWRMPVAIKEKTGTEGANAEKRSEVAAFQEKRKMPKTKTREVYKVREENKRFVRCAMERRWTGRAGVAGLGHSSSINWDRDK